MAEKSIEDIIREALEKYPGGLVNDQKETPLVPLTENKTPETQNVSQDGTIAVQKGEIKVTKPIGTGKYPSILPGHGIMLKANGNEVKGQLLLTEDTDFEIEIVNQEPESNFEIAFSPDKTEAYLKVTLKTGKKYRLMDHDEANSLILVTELVEEIPPPAINVFDILDKMSEMGIIYGVYPKAIESEIKSPTQKPVLIAKGRLPVLPKDAYIEYFFNMQERSEKQVSDKERIDYMDKGQYQSVDIGTVLAIKRPPVPGIPGKAVTGHEIPVTGPREVEIIVCEGAGLTGNGNKAVAAIPGRPVLLGKEKGIKVLPELVINGNVDIHTGHVQFKGDILIRGDVAEGMIVRATGQVKITGHVFSGHVIAGDSIFIGQNLVGGTVTAGGEAAFYSRTLQLMKQLRSTIKRCYEAAQQLKDNPSFSTQDLRIKGDGNLIKMLIDIKFREIPKIVELLVSSINPVIYQPEPMVLECIELMKNSLTGLGPLGIKSLNELLKIEQLLEAIITVGEEALGNMADITVKYSQNSAIEATGSVNITGAGCYHTNIYVGGDATVKGVCRGGEIKAIGTVTISELGSPTGVLTKIETEIKGSIRAGQVFPNVYLKVGGQSYKADVALSSVQCYIDEKIGFVVNVKNK